MPKPKIASKTPYVQELKDGTYYWCACGESKNQPFCDGSHKEAGVFSPVSFALDDTRTVALCGCKQTKTPPFCDGSHKDLDG